jgi:DNA-binding response OmpR family regulator
MGSSILIVHSEKQVRSSARAVLEHGGHEVREQAELSNEVGSPDLLLISWLSLSPVVESLTRLRAQDATRQSRIIVLAPRNEVCAAINALEFGADDCLSVPFEDEELFVRVNACLRRPVEVPSSRSRPHSRITASNARSKVTRNFFRRSSRARLFDTWSERSSMSARGSGLHQSGGKPSLYQGKMPRS